MTAIGKAPLSFMRVYREECGKNVTSDRDGGKDTVCTEVCRVQGKPTGELLFLWKSKTGVVVPAGIPKKTKS